MATSLLSEAFSIPKRTAGGTGFPRIKRSFGTINGVQVGQMNISAGTDDPNLYGRLLTMLQDLADRGDYATLIKIRDSSKRSVGAPKMTGRTYPILEVFNRWKINRHVPSILGTENLWTALEAWRLEARSRTGRPLSARTKESYKANISQLANYNRDCLGLVRTTDTDIPKLLKGYRTYCAEKDYRMPLNQVRTMLSSYARETQTDGKNSELYRAVRRIEPLGSGRKRERVSLMPWELKALIAHLPEHRRQHAWNLACLALRPEEYTGGRWSIVEDEDYGFSYVAIQGTKTENAKRLMPFIDGVKFEGKCSYHGFGRALAKACKRMGVDYVPRDLRSTGRLWLEEAGIPLARVRRYFGHSNKGLDDRYNGYRLKHFLEADAKKINAFIQEFSVAPQMKKRTEKAA